MTGGRVLLVVGSVLLLAGLLLTVSPLIRVRWDVAAMVSAFSGYGVVVGLLALVPAGIWIGRGAGSDPRRWWVLVIVAAVVAGLAAVQAPHWIRDDRPARPGARVRLVSLNLQFGRADAEQIRAATADADLVTMTEATNSAVRRLAAAGLPERFPHRLDVVLPNRGAEGTTILSRWPLGEAVELSPGSQLQNWVTTVDVADLGRLRVVAVHARRPHLTLADWLAEQQAITAALPDDPLTVVAGDFNATGDQLHVPGYVSAADVLGHGWLRTFPAQSAIPPLIRIDHVLLASGLTVTAMESVEIAGTDHVALRTEIALRG